MNLTSLITVDYENIANWTLGENKPNQTQFQNVERLLALESIVAIIILIIEF